MFNIIKVELQLKAYRCNLPQVLFNKSQFNANHCHCCVQVCVCKIFLLPIQTQGQTFCFSETQP
jgi:hypothetical protein